jgi:hypothetical protein
MSDELTPVGGDTSTSESGQNEFSGGLDLVADEISEESTDVSPDASQAEDSSTGEESQPQENADAPQDHGATEAAQAEKEAFKFYGRDWKDTSEAEQHFRSMEGRVRAQGQEVSRLQGLVSEWNKFWEHESRQRAEASAKPEESKDAKPEEKYLKAIDWKAVEYVTKQHGQMAGLQAAIVQLGDHLEKNVLPQFDEKIQQVSEPERQRQEVAQADNYAKNWFYKTSQYVDGNGNPLWPELHETTPGYNDELARTTVDMWARIVRAYPNFGLSRDGLDLAVTKARAAVSAQKKPANAAKAAAGQVARNAAGQFVKQTEATVGNEAEGGTGATAADASRQPAQSMTEAEERKAIREAGRASGNAKFFGIA